jgi:hypothetical protein
MNPLRVWCFLLGGAAVLASGPLHAQARAPVSKAPRIEKKEINPCAIRSACPVSPRSRAIALAWESGLDEHGVPLDASARSRKLAESEIWLRRLAGTFRIEGTYTNYGGASPVRGTAKCDGVGEGPGVSCVITATWKPAKESVKDPQFDKDLLEAMQALFLRFGMDPSTSQVRVTLMDFRAVKMRGVLIDDAVAFSGRSGSGGVGAILRYTMASSVVAIEPGGDVAMRLRVQPTSTPYIVGGLRNSMGRIEPTLWHEFDLQLHREPTVNAGNPQ